MNPNIAPPLLDAHEGLWTGIPYYINNGEPLV
jgi:hypothetical protein